MPDMRNGSYRPHYSNSNYPPPPPPSTFSQHYRDYQNYTSPPLSSHLQQHQQQQLYSTPSQQQHQQYLSNRSPRPFVQGLFQQANFFEPVRSFPNPLSSQPQLQPQSQASLQPPKPAFSQLPTSVSSSTLTSLSSPPLTSSTSMYQHRKHQSADFTGTSNGNGNLGFATRQPRGPDSEVKGFGLV